MSPENRKTSIPEWAQRERQADMTWIRDNLHVLVPVASAGFTAGGRGAIVVDTMSRPTGGGNPFGYLLQEVFENGDDEDIKRMVRDYNPDQEVVFVLIKLHNRTSTYRVGIRTRSN